MQWHVGLDAVDHDFIQGIAHARHGFFAGCAVGDQLADQRVVVRRYGVAAVQVRVDPHAIAAWGMEVLDLAGAGHEVVRVFGVDPAFQGMAADHYVFLGKRQLVAGGDAEHLLDDIDTGDHFRDRVLDLDAGVHLDKVEVAVFVEELEGAGTAVADLDTGVDAALEHFGAGLFVDKGRWRFFQNLLVAALQRAVAVTQVNGVTLAVGQHLDFHVTRIAEELLQIDHRVAEHRTGFAAGQLGRFDQVFFLVHHAHAATTAAASGLDDHRITDVASNLQGRFLVFRQRAVGAGYYRYAGLDHGVLGRHLVAHQANGLGLRADKGEAGVFHLLGEIGVFRKEAVAGVDGGGTGDFSRADDRRNIQIRQRARGRADAYGLVGQAQVHQFAVGGGMHRDGLDAQLFTGAQDAQGDLAAVGDQNFFQHRRLSAVQTMVNRG